MAEQDRTPTDNVARKHRARPGSAVLLSTEQAARDVFACSERKFQYLRSEPWFTVKPRTLGPRTIRWVRAELEEMMASLPAFGGSAEPAHLRAGKMRSLGKAPFVAHKVGDPPPIMPMDQVRALPCKLERAAMERAQLDAEAGTCRLLEDAAYAIRQLLDELDRRAVQQAVDGVSDAIKAAGPAVMGALKKPEKEAPGP